jgi:hypothetical protein
MAIIGMSEKIIESNGKGFLVILLPISFLIIFLVATNFGNSINGKSGVSK